MHPSRLLARDRNERQERLFKVLGSGNSVSTIVSRYINRVVSDGGTIEGAACVYDYLSKNPYIQDSALLIIPSGYKEGKLYAQLPMDGSGDSVVTRSTTGFRANRESFLQSMAINVPRLDYDTDIIGGACPSILSEADGINVFDYSNDFSNVAWGKSNVSVTATNKTSPQAGQNATEITLAAGTSEKFIFQFFTPFGTKKTASFFVNKNGLRFFQIQFNNTTSFCTFDLETGQISAPQGNSFNPTIKFYANGFAKISLSINEVSPLTDAALLAVVGRLNASIVESTSAVGTFDVYGAKLEAGGTATSYIESTSSSSTRAADIITDSFPIPSSGALYGRAYFEGNAGHVISLSDGTTNNSIQIDYGNAGDNILRATIFSSGIPQSIISTSPLSVGFHSFCLSYEENNVSFFVDGVHIGSDASATIPSMDRYHIGSNVGASSWFNGDISALGIKNGSQPSIICSKLSLLTP